MNVRAESKRTHSEVSKPSPLGPSHARRDGSGRNGPSGFAAAPNPDLLPATARSYVDDRPAKIAAEAVKRMDELALIGYPILDPATRSVYEVVIRQVVEGVVE